MAHINHFKLKQERWVRLLIFLGGHAMKLVALATDKIGQNSFTPFNISAHLAMYLTLLRDAQCCPLFLVRYGTGWEYCAVSSQLVVHIAARRPSGVCTWYVCRVSHPVHCAPHCTIPRIIPVTSAIVRLRCPLYSASGVGQ